MPAFAADRPTDEPARVWLRRKWRSLSALALLCIGVVTFDAWLGTCGFEGCPTRSGIRGFRPGEGGRIVDRNDKFLGRIALVRRVNVPLQSIPLHVRQAFLATEDRRFYQHNGLDWRGVIRATVSNMRHGGVREGFSTITMQVARNSFLVNKRYGRTLRRKLIELRLTRLIESELTKDQILELYLNLIYLGNGMNGVEAASRDLFGKSVDKLTVSEGAMLAALPKGPSAYTPRDHYDRGFAAAISCSRSWRRKGTSPQAKRRTTKSTRCALPTTNGAPMRATSRSRSTPCARSSIRFVPDALKEGDVTVYTTLDLNAQRAADRAVLRQTTAVTRETQYAGSHVKGAGAGRARRARSAHRRHPRARRRTSQQARLQSRLQCETPARLRIQAVRLRGRDAGRHDASDARGRRAGGSGAGAQHLASRELRRQLPRHDHAWRRRSPSRRTPPRCA